MLCVPSQISSLRSGMDRICQQGIKPFSDTNQKSTVLLEKKLFVLTKLMQVLLVAEKLSGGVK